MILVAVALGRTLRVGPTSEDGVDLTGTQRPLGDNRVSVLSSLGVVFLAGTPSCLVDDCKPRWAERRRVL